MTPIRRRRAILARCILAHCVLAGALGAAAASALAAEALPVGRLFFSPEERAELEKKRFAPAPPPPKPEAAPLAADPQPTAPPGPEYATVSGHVLRSSGHSATWVNGVPRYDQYRVPADALRLPLAERPRQTVAVKVGETLEARSGHKTDPLKGGTVRVHPAPGAPR